MIDFSISCVWMRARAVLGRSRYGQIAPQRRRSRGINHLPRAGNRRLRARDPRRNFDGEARKGDAVTPGTFDTMILYLRPESSKTGTPEIAGKGGSREQCSSDSQNGPDRSSSSPRTKRV